MTDARQVTLTTTAPPVLTVTGWRGTFAPTVAGGDGGWNEIARPRRKALTEWDGVGVRKLTLPLLLDGYRAGRSIEPACAALERMAQPDTAGGEPPTIRIAGSVPHADLDWVIATDGITWETDNIIWAPAGRLRQGVTLALLEHVPADLVQTAAQAARKKAPKPARTYIVQAGDTLSAIAARLLHDHKKWTAIAALNGIRDPKAIRVGMRLKLP